MTSYNLTKALAIASTLILIGGGCSLFSSKQAAPAPAEDTKMEDKLGDTLSEQSDIIVDAALDEAIFEEEAAGDVSTDASLFTNDEQEMNNLENSYDENEL